MFLRSIHSKGREYLALVESTRIGGRHRQRMVRYFGRRDQVNIEEVLAFVRAIREGRAVAHGEVQAAS